MRASSSMSPSVFQPVYDQLLGSEFGGVQYRNRLVFNTCQPKGASGMTQNERIRMFYTTGQNDNSMALEDRRHFVGLRQEDGRPSWFVTGQPYGPTYGEAAQQAQDTFNDMNWS